MDAKDFPTQLIVVLCLILLAHEMETAETRRSYCLDDLQMGCCTRNTRSTTDTDDQTKIVKQYMCRFEKELHCADCSFTAEKAASMAWSTVPKYLRDIVCANRTELEKRLEELYVFIGNQKPTNGEHNTTLGTISDHVRSTLNTFAYRQNISKNRIEDEFNTNDYHSSTEANRRIKVIFTILGMIYERLSPENKLQQEVLHVMCQANRTINHTKKVLKRTKDYKEQMFKFRHSEKLRCPGGRTNVVKMAECYCSLQKKLMQTRRSVRKHSAKPFLKLITSIRQIRRGLINYARKSSRVIIPKKCQLTSKGPHSKAVGEVPILPFLRKFTKLNEELWENFKVIDINPKNDRVRST